LFSNLREMYKMVMTTNNFWRISGAFLAASGLLFASAWRVEAATNPGAFAVLPAIAQAASQTDTMSVAGFKQVGPKRIEVIFALKVQDKLAAGYSAFVHIVNPTMTTGEGIVWQIPTGLQGGSDSWATGTTVVGQPVFATIPDTVPDGTYDLRYGFYNKDGRLQLSGTDDGDRRYPFAKLVIANSGQSISIPGATAPTPAMEGREDVTPSATDFHQTGPDQFTLRLAWNVKAKIPAGETVFLHIVPASTPDKTVFGNGGGPSTPPDTWPIGQTTTSDPITFALPNTLPDGTYSIRVGLYAMSTSGVRLLLTGNDDGTARYSVGTITVSGNGSTITFQPQ
jgi:hypothetical protein